MKAKDKTAGTKKGRGASEGSTRPKPWRFLVYGFTIVGMVLSGLLIAGLVADGLAFDRTQGGNEPPYTDYTGEPIDWGATYVTNEGFFKDGYVLSLYVDCTTGMVSFEVLQQRWDWRELSGRALVVHKPAEACRAAGFDPKF